MPRFEQALQWKRWAWEASSELRDLGAFPLPEHRARFDTAFCEFEDCTTQWRKLILSLWSDRQLSRAIANHELHSTHTTTEAA